VLSLSLCYDVLDRMLVDLMICQNQYVFVVFVDSYYYPIHVYIL
jgi:hypothetical protein